MISKRPVLVDLVIRGFIRVLAQGLGAKTARIEMRIFQLVIPFHERAMLGVTAHELNRFRDHIYIVRTVDRDAVFRLEPNHPLHLALR